MEIRQTSFNYDRLRGSGPLTSSSSIIFPRSVREATAALTGYSVGFRGGDHHIGNFRITLDTQINSNVVTVNSTFGLRDWSGNWDDEYAGTILVTVTEHDT